MESVLSLKDAKNSLFQSHVVLSDKNQNDTHEVRATNLKHITVIREFFNTFAFLLLNLHKTATYKVQPS